MVDDLNNKGGQERSRIALGEKHEMRYWTKALGVTEAQLAEAVKRVGNPADRAREYFATKR